MPRKKNPARPDPPVTPLERAFKELRHPAEPPPTVSARWLISAAAISVLGAAICGWGALCYLFAQGSWQLLYHPASTITRTPDSANLTFDPIAFAPTDSGMPRLAGWWIPAAPDAPYARFTVLYLHSQDGNLSNAVDELAFLHSIGLNVFAFDYRGYGQSQFQHPGEALLLEDAGFAFSYLTETRHVSPTSILVAGKSIGANLALEFAAAHPELAGAILDQPFDAPMSTVFNDPRAALVPAQLLVRDRYDADAAASALRIPSIWFADPTHVLALTPSEAGAHPAKSPAAAPEAYARIAAPKTRVWLKPDMPAAHDPALEAQRSAALNRWLDDLSAKPPRP
jgi:pimeloyl-ACP methyl ester carboxylesterase